MPTPDGRPLNVFVFGAGASLHLGAPLASDVVMSAVCDYCWHSEDDLWIQNFEAIVRFYDSLTKSKALDYLKRAREQHTLPPIGQLPGLEEIVTAVEDSHLDELKLALHDVLYRIISKQAQMGDVYDGVVFGIPTHWRNLYDQLVDYVLPVRDSNAFISFNYDLALDTALSINNHGLLGDYGLPFAHVSNFPDYERIRVGKREPKDVDLIKLHGSFNWGWCRKCNSYSLHYWGDFRKIASSKCGTCQSYLLPVLVPPARNKSKHIKVLEPLWERARSVLSRSDSLVVVGYSFNRVDQEAIDLFQHTLRENRHLRRLVIADPNSRCLVDLVCGFLGRQVRETITFASFEEMMARLVGPMKGLLPNWP